MKRWAQLWFSIAVVSPAAHTADVELEIALPEPEWLLPETSSQPCYLFGGTREEVCKTQLLPEGMSLLGEEQLILDLAPLVAAGDYEAVLARVRTQFPVEVALLEAGDREGFLRTRVPTDGRQQLPPPSGPERPAQRRTDNATQNMQRNIRDISGNNENAFADRRGLDGLPDFISASLLYAIGHSYFSVQQYLPAATAFQLVLVPLPDHLRAHESLGMLYLRTERYADARVHLAEALQLGLDTANVNAALGYLDQKTRRYQSAASAFQQALVLEPDNEGVRRGLLLALIQIREHAPARVLVEQLLREDPDDPDLWLHRAQAALSAGEPAVALASLETARRLGDDSAANRHACAVLHMESGNIARAVDLLQGSARGLAFPLVDQALGWLANENEWDDFRALSASVDRTALGGAEQSRLLTRRASLALHDGNRRAASTALQEALVLDPANADALIALGQIHRAERDYGRAELLFRHASAYPTAREDALVARAEVAIDQEDFDGAIAHLSSVVAGNPERGDLRRNIALLEDLALLRTQR